MTKPILRLGPAEELDDEYDPLLGRVVRDNERSSADIWVAPELTRDPFDPDAPAIDLGPDSDMPVSSEEEHAPPHTPSPFDETWPESSSPPPSIFAQAQSDRDAAPESSDTSFESEIPVLTPATEDVTDPVLSEKRPIDPLFADPLFDEPPAFIKQVNDDQEPTPTPEKRRGWLGKLFGGRRQDQQEAEAVSDWASVSQLPEPSQPPPTAEDVLQPEPILDQIEAQGPDTEATPLENGSPASLSDDDSSHLVESAEPNAADVPDTLQSVFAPDFEEVVSAPIEIDIAEQPEQVAPAEQSDDLHAVQDPYEPEETAESASPPKADETPAMDEQVPVEPELSTPEQSPTLETEPEPEQPPEPDLVMAVEPALIEEPAPPTSMEAEPPADAPALQQDDATTDDTQTSPAIALTSDAVAEPTPEPQPAAAPMRRDAQAQPAVRPKGRRRRKRKKNHLGAFFGTMLFGMAFLFTFASSFALLGFPWDALSAYRWVWIGLGLASIAVWAVGRGWRMVLASAVVTGLNLWITIPAAGDQPTGNDVARAVVGWANLEASEAALQKVMADAERNQASLVMLAEAPVGVMRPPPGWTLIEAPVPGDPTAIAVLSKANWRAVTAPGEPTMARPVDGALTVIGVHPIDATARGRKSPQRDALINRAAARAGIQEGPTIVVGDFDASAWDRSIQRFREAGNVKRVRCGGWAGSTEMRVLGLIGIAVDHAFVREVQVTHCRVGGVLPGGSHKPLWLYVAPKAPDPDSAQR